jgi:hypothetical protein
MAVDGKAWAAPWEITIKIKIKSKRFKKALGEADGPEQNSWPMSN